MSYAARAMRGPAPAFDFDPEKADLRTALRHTPVLPAPTTVEDLLARLNDRKIADASADLAEIILDAHYPDVPKRLFEFEKTPRTDSTSFFEPIHRTANSNIPLPAPRWSYRFLIVMLGLVLLSGLASFAWQPARPVEEPLQSIVTTAPTPAEAEIEYSGIISFEGPDVPIASADEVAKSPGEPQREHYVQPVNPSETVAEMTEPPLTPTITPRDTENVQLASRPTSLPSEMMPGRSDPVQAHSEGAVAMPLAKAVLRGLVDTIVDNEREQTKPAGPYGTWAVSRNMCSSKMQRKGHLLTYITPRGARAGDTSCTFDRSTRGTQALQVTASCSDGKATWKSKVTLSASGDRLVWSSEKGSSTYVRCP
jgi:hypothetical protein